MLEAEVTQQTVCVLVGLRRAGQCCLLHLELGDGDTQRANDAFGIL